MEDPRLRSVYGVWVDRASGEASVFWRLCLFVFLFFVSSVTFARTELETQKGPFHGYYYLCSDVKNIRNSLINDRPYFYGWSPKELDDLWDYINNCRPRFQADVDETLPLLDTLKNQVRSGEFEAARQRAEAAARLPPPPPPPPPPKPHDRRCEKPPYGETSDEYKVAESSIRNVASFIAKSSGEPINEVMRIQIPAALSEICDAKYAPGANRAAFYAVDINDQLFEATTTTALTMKYLVTKRNLENLKKHSRQMSVEDFVLDGPALVDKQSISISGVYVPVDGLELLYANSMAVAAAGYSSSAGSPPSVLLMTNHAMRSLRRRLLECQSNPAFQMGCNVTLRGTVIICTETNAYGTKNDKPCLNVQDGE